MRMYVLTLERKDLFFAASTGVRSVSKYRAFQACKQFIMHTHMM
jgi:hypothetical protein